MRLRGAASLVALALGLGLVQSTPQAAAAATRTEKQTRPYVVGLSSAVLIRPQFDQVGGATFTPPPGATSVVLKVTDNLGSALGLATAAAACQDGVDGGFCGSTQRDFCTQMRTPVAISDKKPLEVAIFGATTCGSSPAIGTAGTVTATFFVPKPPPPAFKVLARKVQTDAYLATQVVSSLSFATPPKATHLLIEITDAAGQALGLPTGATACQDNNGNRICGEEGETSLAFCTKTSRPLAIKPGEEVTVFVNALDVCSGGPAVGTTGTVKATFLITAPKRS
jgi:hypothetical protein